MKSEFLILISIGIFVTSSCTSCKGDATNEEKSTKSVENNFLSDYDFFPDDAGNRTGDIVNVDTFAFHNTVGLRLERPISNEELSSIESGKYVYVGTPEENCLVVINDFITDTKVNEKLTTQHSRVNKNCKSNHIPLPNFWSIKFPDKRTKSHLNPKSKIFISILKYGIRTKRIDPNKSSMPYKMKHGEVGGIITNEDNTRAIYFVQKW